MQGKNGSKNNYNILTMPVRATLVYLGHIKKYFLRLKFLANEKWIGKNLRNSGKETCKSIIIRDLMVCLRGQVTDESLGNSMPEGVGGPCITVSSINLSDTAEEA